jgi:hypothetical protein
MTTILGSGGTSEIGVGTNTAPHGMLKVLMDLLDGSKFTTKEMVPYPGTYGSPMSYVDSWGTGVDNFLQRAGEVEGDQVWVGYSQGAKVVRESVKEGRKQGIHPKVVILVADPERSPNQEHMVGRRPFPANSYGVVKNDFIQPEAGQRIITVSVTGDTISALPPGNPIRSIADFTPYMGQNLQLWAQMVIQICLAKQVQRWWDIKNWQSWGGAIAYLRGYLFDGRHTVAYINEGELAAVAALLNGLE